MLHWPAVLPRRRTFQNVIVRTMTQPPTANVAPMQLACRFDRQTARVWGTAILSERVLDEPFRNAPRNHGCCDRIAGDYRNGVGAL
jgi:hypothetical protein